MHTYAGAEPTDVTRVEGHGPVTEAWVREHLGPHVRFTIRPVSTSPARPRSTPTRSLTGTAEAVHMMTPADTFPWGASTARTHQIDHTRAFRHRGPPGQSRIGNYGPMTSFHHRIKTHSRLAGAATLPRDLRLARPCTARRTSSTTPVPDACGVVRRMSPAEAELSRALFELAA